MKDEFNMDKILSMKVEDLGLKDDVIVALNQVLGDDRRTIEDLIRLDDHNFQELDANVREKVINGVRHALEVLNPNLHLGMSYEEVWDLKYSGNHVFERLLDEKLNPGDYVGFPLEYVRTCGLSFADDGLGIVSCENRPQDNNYILILQYLGNYQFLELISGKILMGDSNSSEMFCGEDEIDTFRNMEEFEKSLNVFTEHPLKVEVAPSGYNDAVSYKVDGELKFVYATTTLKNQQYIISTLDEMEKLSRDQMKQDVQALKSSDEFNALSVNDFIESHSHRL